MPCRWIEEQLNNLKTAKVAVMYASAYGNTASLAQAISRGITKAGVGVEMVNLEEVDTVEAGEILKESQGFCIGISRSASMPSGPCPCIGYCKPFCSDPAI